MATYAVGDVQGCYLSLQALLQKIDFEPRRDRLWLCGDLVNRGPRSLEVLRWARALDERLVCVLGNHEITLLAAADGVMEPRAHPALRKVLEAADAAALLAWLASRPLLHREGGRLLVHAGLAPAWTLEEAEGRARAVERRLQGAERRVFLRGYYAGPPVEDDALSLAILTRIRVCDAQGRMADGHTGPPERLPAAYQPWYALPSPRDPAVTVLFGHWASLGVRFGPGYLSLDSGCVWGGALSAVRFEDGALFQVPAQAGEVLQHKLWAASQLTAK